MTDDPKTRPPDPAHRESFPSETSVIDSVGGVGGADEPVYQLGELVAFQSLGALWRRCRYGTIDALIPSTCQREELLYRIADGDGSYWLRRARELRPAIPKVARPPKEGDA